MTPMDRANVLTSLFRRVQWNLHRFDCLHGERERMIPLSKPIHAFLSLSIASRMALITLRFLSMVDSQVAPFHIGYIATPYSRSRRLTDGILHARLIESIIQDAIKYIRQTFIDHRSISILVHGNYQGKWLKWCSRWNCTYMNRLSIIECADEIQRVIHVYLSLPLSLAHILFRYHWSVRWIIDDRIAEDWRSKSWRNGFEKWLVALWRVSEFIWRMSDEVNHALEWRERETYWHWRVFSPSQGIDDELPLSVFFRFFSFPSIKISRFLSRWFARRNTDHFHRSTMDVYICTVIDYLDFSGVVSHFFFSLELRIRL